MFSIEFLHTIREHEINAISKHFPPGARVLEIGGGTGYQAKLLTDRGYAVTAIDVGTSNYKGNQVFPVTDYDGKVFPFADATFDVVFSSHVLEHIADPSQIHSEIRRVLKPGGYCVHVMPTAVWRFWQGVANYVEFFQRVAPLMPEMVPRRFRQSEWNRPSIVFEEVGRLRKQYLRVPRHGATGNAFTELWTFSRRHWADHFRRNNWVVLRTEPLGLFYSGHMVFGKRWSLRARARVARVLGSATMLYVVQPIAEGPFPERRACRGGG
jgi:SAM-dependent methyltransferase